MTILWLVFTEKPETWEMQKPWKAAKLWPNFCFNESLGLQLKQLLESGTGSLCTFKAGSEKNA